MVIFLSGPPKERFEVRPRTNRRRIPFLDIDPQFFIESYE